jgi:tetratricopeptide (TPR) repeat protein
MALSEEDKEALEHYTKMLRTLTKNLYRLKEQEAKFGGLNVPNHILNQIDETNDQIKHSKLEIERLGNSFVQVEPTLNEKRDHDYLLENADYDDSFLYPTPSFFIGRTESISEIQQAIQKNNTVVIGGMAGIGKTYLAAKLVDLLNNERLVLWIDCVSYTYLEQILERVAEFLSRKAGSKKLLRALRSPQLEKNRIIDIAVSEIDRHKLLFVFDNFESESNESVVLFLVKLNQVAKESGVIITSRERINSVRFVNTPYHLSLLRLNLSDGISLVKYYLSILGLPAYTEDVIEQAYKKVDGHPYFLRLIVVLSEIFPLEDIIAELPQLTKEAQEYIKKHVFDQLDVSSWTLLRNLSIIRGEFSIKSIDYLCTEDCTESVNKLLRRFLIERPTKNGSFYRIHELIREHGISLIDRRNIPSIHEMAAKYYNSIDMKTYVEYQELIYHLLEANDADRASQVAEELFGMAIHHGAFDYVIEYSGEIIKEKRILKRDVVYFARGRALRFKERLTEALEAYKQATMGENSHITDTAKAEVAGMMIKLSKNSDDRKWKEACSIYRQLTKSQDISVKISSMGTLGYLSAREGDKQKSIKQLNKALILAEKFGLMRNIAEILQGLGYVYTVIDKDKSIKYYEKARDIRDTIKEIFGGQDTEANYALHNNLANLYEDVEKYTNAKVSSIVCVDIDRYLQVPDRLVGSLHRLGRVYCFNHEYKLAEDVFLEELSFIEEYNIEADMKLYTLEWLVVAQWCLQKFDKAVERLLEFLLLLENEGKSGNLRHITIEHDPLMNRDKWSLLGNKSKQVHILTLPRGYKMQQVNIWIQNVLKRRPELRNVYSPLINTMYLPPISGDRSK